MKKEVYMYHCERCKKITTNPEGWYLLESKRVVDNSPWRGYPYKETTQICPECHAKQKKGDRFHGKVYWCPNCGYEMKPRPGYDQYDCEVCRLRFNGNELYGLVTRSGQNYDGTRSNLEC